MTYVDGARSSCVQKRASSLGINQQRYLGTTAEYQYSSSAVVSSQWLTLIIPIHSSLKCRSGLGSGRLIYDDRPASKAAIMWRWIVELPSNKRRWGTHLFCKKLSLPVWKYYPDIQVKGWKRLIHSCGESHHNFWAVHPVADRQASWRNPPFSLQPRLLHLFLSCSGIKWLNPTPRKLRPY